MIELYIMIAWLAIMLFVGLWAGAGKRAPKSKEDWGTAGRSFHWITNYFTAHATQLSALTFMGFPGLLYVFGVPVFYAHYLAYMLGTCGFFVLFGPKMWRLGKKFGHMTPTDFLVQYYGGGKWFGYFLGAIFFLALIPYIQIQVLGTGWVFEQASGGLIPVWLGALIAYAIITIYVWAGGLRAVAYTDIIQGAMLLFGLWTGSIAIIMVFGGGFVNVFTQAATKLPELVAVTGFKGWNWAYTLSWALAVGAGWTFHAHMWLRMYTPRSETHARTWAGVQYAENCLHGIILTGAMLAVAIALPGLRADMAWLQATQKIFPVWLYGIMLAAVVAAIFSTVDSQVHALGLIVTHDFVERAGKKLTDQQFIWANRITVVIVVAAGYILAFVYPYPLGILSGYPASLGFILCPTIVFAAAHQRWVTKQGAIIGLIAGYIAMVITSVPPYANLFSIYFGCWGALVNTIVLIIVSLVTKTKPTEEQVKAIREASW